ncbi:MAG: transposase [Pseudobacteriovorax sp.]|nr:transposase [Pseudobacteriovorax sp.]
MEVLTSYFLFVIEDWHKSFRNKNSLNSAKRLAFALLVTLGRKLFCRSVMSAGLDQLDWSKYYKLFSRSVWSCEGLFRSVLVRALPLIEEKYIAIAYDDTLIKKTGRKIKLNTWNRDSLSPPWRVNFVKGYRFIQASLLLPLYLNWSGTRACRGLPVQLKVLPKHKKPSSRASQQTWEAYEELVKKSNSSTKLVFMMRFMRNELDMAGYKDKTMIVPVDGSYINKTTLNHDIDRVVLVGRVRKTARFFFKEENPKGRQFYSKASFTAKEFQQDRASPYAVSEFYYAGKYRPVRFKEIADVYQKYSTKKKPLRLIVIAPTPYRRNAKGRLQCRDPAFLLTHDFETPTTLLIQKYFDRWQIEVNFKEEKQCMSLGKQQNWSKETVEKVPGFIAACYSALTLAGVLRFGDDPAHSELPELPKWRRKRSLRPSFQDYQSVLRGEIAKINGLDLGTTKLNLTFERLAQKACA